MSPRQTRPSESGSSTATITLPAASVRAEILGQHAALRTFLAHAAAVAGAAAQGDGIAARLLFPVCARLRTRLERHMAFEEGVLVPSLRESDACGPARAAHLLDEHVRQRQELSTLVAIAQGHADGDAATDVRGAALTLQTLISDILVDMRHEEKDLLAPDVLHDDAVVVDQASD